MRGRMILWLVVGLLVGLAIGWWVGMSASPSLTPKCSLAMVVRGNNDAAVSGAIVEITYRNQLYLGETSAAGSYTWGFPCKPDARSRLVVDAPGYETYERQDPTQAGNPLKIALRPLVAPHAPPIVKQTDDGKFYDENATVVQVPAGKRVTLKAMDLWKGPADVAPECAKAYLRFTWIVREPYPNGGEDLTIETLIPMGNGRTEVIGSGSMGSTQTGWCNEITFFNSSLQEYRVEIRYASGMMGS